jgi:hypothetical protein
MHEPSGLEKLGMIMTAFTSLFARASRVASRQMPVRAPVGISRTRRLRLWIVSRKPKVGWRLDGHGVAGLRHGPQREIERLRAADGDDELVVAERAAGLEIAAGNLAGERIVGEVHRIATEERGIVPAHRGEDSRELLRGKKVWSGQAAPNGTYVGSLASESTSAVRSLTPT